MKFRETAIVSGGFLAQQFSVFATGILIARYLGAEGYGTLGILKSLSTVLVIVTPLGLDLALLKHASFYREQPELQRTLTRALRGVAAAGNLLLLAAVALWVGPRLAGLYSDIPDFSALCVITMAGLVAAADIQVSGALYRVHDRVVLYSVIVNYIQPALRLAVSFALLSAGGGTKGIVWVNTAMFFAAAAMIALVDRRLRGPALRLPPAELARQVGAVLSESLWMAMSLLVYQLIRLIDILILAALTSPAVAGQYTAMSSVAQLIQIYPNAVAQTLGPEIALAYKQNDPDGIVTALGNYLRKASILGGYIFAGVAVFGTDLDQVFGAGFTFPWPLPALLACGWFVSATLAPFGYVLSMTGRHRQEFVVLTAGAALLVGLLLLLVPPLGAVGAALSVASAFITVNIVRCGYVIRIIGRNPLKLRHCAAPALLLAAALACRVAGSLVASRSLPLLVAECVCYSALAGGLTWRLLASPGERGAALQILARRRHAT